MEDEGESETGRGVEGELRLREGEVRER